MGLIKRLWDTFRLRKIPKSTLDTIMKDNYESRGCYNCRYGHHYESRRYCNRTFGRSYCKIIKDSTEAGFICNEHAYAAEFLLREYNLRQSINLKEQLCYREMEHK